jgi:hypothetical protein
LNRKPSTQNYIYICPKEENILILIQSGKRPKAVKGLAPKPIAGIE